MSSSSQFEKKFKRKSTCPVPDRGGTRLGEGSSRSQTGHNDPFYKRPKAVLINDRQWQYIQRRYHMSPRELQIAKLICQGFRNDDIARDLHITLGTVKTHVRNIYRRVQVKSKIAMLLRFVADARELFAPYDATPLIPAVDLASRPGIVPTH